MQDEDEPLNNCWKEFKIKILTGSGTNRVSRMGRVQQSSRLVGEREQQEEEATKRKQAEAEVRALRQKGVSEAKSLQNKKLTVATGAK